MLFQLSSTHPDSHKQKISIIRARLTPFMRQKRLLLGTPKRWRENYWCELKFGQITLWSMAEFSSALGKCSRCHQQLSTWMSKIELLWWNDPPPYLDFLNLTSKCFAQFLSPHYCFEPHQLALCGLIQFKLFSKYLLLCSAEKRSYRFGTI